jgi:hypothetical protein
VKLKLTGADQYVSFSLDYVVLGHDPQNNCLTLEVPQD